MLDNELRAAFVMALRDIWVNISLYYEVKVPNYVKVWDEMDGSITLPSTYHDISTYDNLKEFMIKYLTM